MTDKTIYISQSRKEMLARMPVIQTSVVKSRDGRYVIHKTTITDIKPIGYYEKIMNGDYKEEVI